MLQLSIMHIRGRLESAQSAIRRFLSLGNRYCWNRAKGVVQNSPLKMGYARVSTDEQNLDLQRQALEAEGC